MNRTTSLLLAAVGFNTLMLVMLYLLLGDALAEETLPFFGIGLLFTAVLAGVLLWIDSSVPAGERMEPTEPASPSSPADAPEQTSAAPAIQLLSILQRKGRLIDFLNEDIQQFEDAQIGAAVRTVHAGCKEALDEIVDLEPVMDDAEGTSVTIESGFDAQAIRLTGNVQGDPPFRGALRHRGWRIDRIDLPERMKDTDDIVAAAEIEIG